MARYLAAVHEEAVRRGYDFDKSKIGRRRASTQMTETRGQLLYEWEHLQRKLAIRSPVWANQWMEVSLPDPHPLFRIVAGKVREWERVRE